MFLAMWSIFPLSCKTNILEAYVFLIALEDGTSNVSNFTPFSRASSFSEALY
jgi:hypothetical protein